MKKKYSFRLDTNLMKQLKPFGKNMTLNVTNAIQMYCQGAIQKPDNDHTKTIQILESTIMDLRQDKDILQKRLDYYMLPWYKKVFLPLYNKK